MRKDKALTPYRVLFKHSTHSDKIHVCIGYVIEQKGNIGVLGSLLVNSERVSCKDKYAIVKCGDQINLKLLLR